MKYKCLVFNKDQGSTTLEEKTDLFRPLESGEVKIKAEYSGINYKDALGVLNQGQIFKKSPIVPGIDVAGTVIESRSKKFKEGDGVLINGMGLGEDKDGGYSQYVWAHEDIIVPRPKKLSAYQAMTLGTAGFTAALAVDRMLTNGQSFDKGPILVSGATGGVGGFAIQILVQLGFFVEATTSRPGEYKNYLEDLGAHYVSDVKDLLEKKPPLAKAMWGGVVDNLGGGFLESVLPHINLWGNVSSIGLALGTEVNTTVMPFILRGVSLLGASSNNCSKEKRDELWQLLATDWRPEKIEELVTQNISLEGVVSACEKLLQHRNHGRIVIAIT